MQSALMFDSHAVAHTQQPASIAHDVALRLAERDQIRQRLDAFMLRERGIPAFSTIVDRWMPPLSNSLALCLARQIPTASIEHLTVDGTARWLSSHIASHAAVMGFRRDCWVSNSYKQSLTVLPVIQKVSGNVVHVRNTKVVTPAFRPNLQHLPVLSSIPAKFARPEWGLEIRGTLADLHHALRTRARGVEDTTPDFSFLWQECLHRSTKPPAYAFVDLGGYARKVQRWDMYASSYIRPPASWYYLLYLGMFLTGERALIATTIEEDDESIRMLFVESIAVLKEATGVEPLILWTPHASPTMVTTTSQPLTYNEFHPTVLEDGWTNHVSLPDSHVSCYEASARIADAIARLPLKK